MKKQKRTGAPGQTLVEFALVLPVLLMTLMGLTDFSRAYAVYSNLFNAAREGARFGVVHPTDLDGIYSHTLDNIRLVEHDQVAVMVVFDSGPGTEPKDINDVQIGDRVVVTVQYSVEMITPLIRAITERLDIDTTAARTIATLGSAVGPPPPGGPPPGPPDDTATPTVTGTPPTSTPTPTPEGPTPTPTFTPTPTPIGGVAPINIDIPLWDGDMVVTGSAQPGETVYLRDIQNPVLDLSTMVDANGIFRFDLPIALMVGHVIRVHGYGNIDYALVQGSVTPTPTPTPTSTPMPTPTPSSQYIDIAPICGPTGINNIVISGYLWPTSKGNITIYWDGAIVEVVSPPRSEFERTITVDASNGIHEVLASTNQQDHKYFDTKYFESPCPVTPTPVIQEPNLVVESINLENDGTLSTYDPLTFTVAIRNIGAAAANSLFWVDLIADPAVEPPTPGDLSNEVGIAWAAISSLAQGESVSLSLYYEGFDSTGDHTAWALADTWEQITESDEEDNVGGPVSITVDLQGPIPTPTPTPGGDGSISGSTWLYVSGNVVPQGRVNVSCYDGDTLVAETLSDQDGNYLLENIPAGTYMVIGETVIDGAFYADQVTDIIVENGLTTEYITLVLYEW